MSDTRTQPALSLRAAQIVDTVLSDLYDHFVLLCEECVGLVLFPIQPFSGCAQHKVLLTWGHLTWRLYLST